MFNVRIFFFVSILIFLIFSELTIPFFINNKQYSLKYNVSYLCGYISLFFKKFLNITINIHNKLEKPTNNKNSILLVNHTSYLDWLLLSIYVNKHHMANDIVFIAKKSLLFLPYFGQQGKNWNMIFIERSWEKDKHKIEQKVSKLKNKIIIIFPEGTRKTIKNYKESVNYSIKNNLPIYDNLLLPRTKGSWKIINILNNENKLDKIIDMSIIFPKYIKTELSNKTIMKGKLGNVYVNFKNINIPKSDILANKDSFKIWMYEIWKKKDKFMNNFSKNNFNNFKYFNKNEFLINLLILFLCFQIIRKLGWKYLIANTILLNVIKILF